MCIENRAASFVDIRPVDGGGKNPMEPDRPERGPVRAVVHRFGRVATGFTGFLGPLR